MEQFLGMIIINGGAKIQRHRHNNNAIKAEVTATLGATLDRVSLRNSAVTFSTLWLGRRGRCRGFCKICRRIPVSFGLVLAMKSVGIGAVPPESIRSAESNVLYQMKTERRGKKAFDYSKPNIRDFFNLLCHF
uniref:Uncharacterized protein n=1 Tax=Steinernema glaseri TaxID=37863 RepID=A0A1I7Y9Q7_9BILA